MDHRADNGAALMPRDRAIAVTNVGSRDLRAFEAFYRASFESVLSASIAFCGDKELAREATQEAFSRCLARWARLSGRQWREGWVMKTAFNYCRRHLRRRRLQESIVKRSQGPRSYDLGVPDSDLVAAIKRLPIRQREAILLYYIADHPVAAVAEVMGVSEGAVKAHLFKAREFLRQELTVNQSASH